MASRLGSRLLLFAITLAVIEGFLQISGHLWTRVNDILSPEISGWILDPLLGVRGNPRYPEHDVAGYRNRARPVNAPIVVLGDSQAYGVGVHRDEAWPHLAPVKHVNRTGCLQHGYSGLL